MVREEIMMEKLSLDLKKNVTKYRHDFFEVVGLRIIASSFHIYAYVTTPRELQQRCM